MATNLQVFTSSSRRFAACDCWTSWQVMQRDSDWW